jgi:MFS family permease
MDGFREHFLDKYFAYRRQYVAAIAERAPHRVRLAITSEIARLAFVVCGAALCAFIFGLLTVGAFGVDGFGWREAVFAACTLSAAAFGLLSLRGILDALAAARALPES